jgi:hypothetical protein
VNAPPSIEPGQSTRERYAMHASDPACSGCHALIDPIGFGFEHYDAVGRRRETDEGVAVDASGEITGAGEGAIAFDGVGELAAILADSAESQACFARQWSTFALGGLAQDLGLACMGEAVVDGLASADGRLDATVLALVEAPGFGLRRADDDDAVPEPADSSAGDEAAAESASAAESTSGGVAPDPALEVTIVQTGLWAEGECNEVTVTNVSEMAVTWEVPLELTGTITTVWNAVATPSGDVTIFSGAPHNATIEPAASAGFGFCLMY